jgi:hypothetical protein
MSMYLGINTFQILNQLLSEYSLWSLLQCPPPIIRVCYIYFKNLYFYVDFIFDKFIGYT